MQETVNTAASRERGSEDQLLGSARLVKRQDGQNVSNFVSVSNETLENVLLAFRDSLTRNNVTVHVQIYILQWLGFVMVSCLNRAVTH